MSILEDYIFPYKDYKYAFTWTKPEHNWSRKFLTKEKPMKVEFIREEPTPPPLKEVVLRLNEDEYSFIKQVFSGKDWSCYGSEYEKVRARFLDLLNSPAKTYVDYAKCFK